MSRSTVSLRCRATAVVLLLCAACSPSGAKESGAADPAAPMGPTAASPPSASAPPEPTPSRADVSPAATRQVRVSDAASLTAALRAARPGTVISLADGSYRGDDVEDQEPGQPGRFTASVPGTAGAPITLRGSRKAVLDGGGPRGGYGLHLRGADHWRLEGFTVSSASKGIVLDASSHVRIERVRVTDIGDEGVHFRSFSSDNVLANSEIDTTGVDSPQFGEGVYVGSAVSNWPTYSGGRPDASDRNQIIDNMVSATTAENVDIKEGSTGGVVRGNVFDGAALAGKNSADSWLDVKGNAYLIEANSGTDTLLDGFQVHVLVPGWGERNTFERNTLAVNAPGVGIWLQNSVVDKGNVVRCNNRVTGAEQGDYATNSYSKIACVN